MKLSVRGLVLRVFKKSIPYLSSQSCCRGAAAPTRHSQGLNELPSFLGTSEGGRALPIRWGHMSVFGMPLLKGLRYRDGVTVQVQRSEDDLWELVPSSHSIVLGTELKLSGLVASPSSC